MKQGSLLAYAMPVHQLCMMILHEKYSVNYPTYLLFSNQHGSGPDVVGEVTFDCMSNMLC